MTTAAKTDSGTKPKREAVKTAYVILRRIEGGAWLPVDDRLASSAAGAVRAHYHNGDGQEGVYVAVPRRSWEPIAIAIERTEKLVFRATGAASLQGEGDAVAETQLAGGVSVAEHDPDAEAAPTDVTDPDDAPF